MLPTSSCIDNVMSQATKLVPVEYDADTDYSHSTTCNSATAIEEGVIVGETIEDKEPSTICTTTPTSTLTLSSPQDEAAAVISRNKRLDAKKMQRRVLYAIAMQQTRLEMLNKCIVEKMELAIDLHAATTLGKEQQQRASSSCSSSSSSTSKGGELVAMLCLNKVYRMRIQREKVYANIVMLEMQVEEIQNRLDQETGSIPLFVRQDDVQVPTTPSAAP